MKKKREIRLGYIFMSLDSNEKKEWMDEWMMERHPDAHQSKRG